MKRRHRRNSRNQSISRCRIVFPLRFGNFPAIYGEIMRKNAIKFHRKCFTRGNIFSISPLLQAALIHSSILQTISSRVDFPLCPLNTIYQNDLFEVGKDFPVINFTRVIYLKCHFVKDLQHLRIEHLKSKPSVFLNSNFLSATSSKWKNHRKRCRRSDSFSSETSSDIPWHENPIKIALRWRKNFVITPF